MTKSEVATRELEIPRSVPATRKCAGRATKAQEMAMRADALLRAGEDPHTVAQEVGYKTVHGMLGAISLVRNRQERERAVKPREAAAPEQEEAAPQETDRATAPQTEDKPGRAAQDAAGAPQEPDGTERMPLGDAPTPERVAELRAGGLETYLKSGRFALRRRGNERFARLWEIDHPNNNVTLGPREIAEVARLLECMDKLMQDRRREG